MDMILEYRKNSSNFFTHLNEDCQVTFMLLFKLNKETKQKIEYHHIHHPKTSNTQLLAKVHTKQIVTIFV